MTERTTLDIVGIGPGAPQYVTMTVRDLVAAADVVAGFRTVLQVVADHIRGEAVTLDYRNQADGIRMLDQALAAGKRAVLCAHGDASFSGDELVALARDICGPVRLTPGISSVQVACARSQLKMEQTLFITFHKRADIAADQDELAATVVTGRRNVIALPRPWDFMPAALARLLIERGADPARPVTVYERLTQEGDAEHQFTLAGLAQHTVEFSDLSIVVVPRKAETAS